MSMDDTLKTTENGNSLISQRRLHAQNEGQQEYVERRNHVLKTAAAVFKEKGYRAASCIITRPEKRNSFTRSCMKRS
jgi:hypothetical protein